MALPIQQARADYISSTLGTAGPSDFAVLTLGATDVALNGPGTTMGNVGISDAGNLQLNASNNAPVSNTAIVENLYLGNSATVNNTSQVSGSIFTNQNSLLNAAVSTAISAASTFGSLTATSGTPTSVTGNTTINGGPGVTVVDLSTINLGNGQTLTLNGPAGSQFVINSPSMTLHSSLINLAGGVTANDVVFNLTGTGNNLQTSGGLNNESVINGIVLDAHGGVGMVPGEINGELIAGPAGQSVHIVSGGNVNGVTQTPEPGTISLLACGLLGLLIVGGHRKRMLIS